MAFTLSRVVETIRNGGKTGGSFVGVDIGSSSIKIVQLAVKEGTVVLETYGDISNSIYADAEPGKTGQASAHGHGMEIADILHEVHAFARRSAVAIPLSETLMNILDMPKRDPEQMRLLVPSEVRKFIPVPLDRVMLDWYPLEEEEVSAFDIVRPHAQTEAHMHKVMVVAIRNETVHKLAAIVSESGLTSEFYEIEMFSVVRSCAPSIDAPVLILDFGASAVKAYVVDERRIVLVTRLIPTGGQTISESVVKSLSCSFAEAEREKHQKGLLEGSAIAATIKMSFASLPTYVAQMFEEHISRGGKPVTRIILCGGGSFMPGIAEFVASSLSLPTEMLRAFDRTRGPMILKNTLREDGPNYAVAVGLALRGIGR